MCCTPNGGGIASFRRRPWCRNTSPLPWPAPARRAQRQRAGSERQARSARRVLDRCFEALCVEGRHTLDPPETLRRVPDGEREHRLRIRGIDDVDEIVVALRVVDRLDLDAQFVELGLGLLDPLRLFACVLRAQISKQHIFHGYLHVVWIVLHEDLASIRLPASSAHAISFSKCDNRAAKVPQRSGASVGLRSSPKASACSQAPRLWSNYRPTAARSAKLVPTCRGIRRPPDATVQILETKAPRKRRDGGLPCVESRWLMRFLQPSWY